MGTGVTSASEYDERSAAAATFLEPTSAQHRAPESAIGAGDKTHLQKAGWLRARANFDGDWAISRPSLHV
jgi:hypothetical protein